MNDNNQKKFTQLRSWNLPIGEYLITGSGLLGILNLREIGDVDIIVSDALWKKLADQFGVTVKEGIERIEFPDGLIEAFPASNPYNSEIPNRIADAEFIEGLPFDTVETFLYYKRKMGREKDLRDIQLLEGHL